MPEEASFGRWLKERRKALDLTQEALGERVGCAGETIRRFEAERLRPSREMAARLAAQLALDGAETEHFIQAARQVTGATPPAAPASAPPSTMRGLPVPLTPLIGRAAEATAVVRLLQRKDVRLLTLTGPGGSGKTRLALAVAADVAAHFADGVCFVDLTPIGDPSLVVSAIAGALGVKEVSGAPVLDLLTAELQAKHLLLVLDNFEQVLAAGPLLADLLRAAPGLTLLVTSRATLHVSGEHEHPVPPLQLPNLQQLPDLTALTQYAAVELFVQRAQAARPDFALSEVNAPAVAEICVHLDGLPLALELAAARSKLLSPQALLTRLRSRLTVLTGGARDLPARQQTLRNTIDWSYNLLAAAEQTLFARLAVFVGGCTLAAAEVVCQANGAVPLEVLDALQALVDQSLLQQVEGPDDEPRFWMLETIREYALEQLGLREERETISQLHAAYFASFTEAADPELRGTNQKFWLRRLASDLDNIRQALQWSYESGEPELHLRLCAALWGFWVVRGHLSEGRRWLEGALARAGQALPVLQAKARLGAGNVLARQGDYQRAEQMWAESLALFRAHDDLTSAVSVLHTIAWQSNIQGDFTRAATFATEGVALAEHNGDQRGLANSLQQLAVALQNLGQVAQAAAHLERGLVLAREVRDKRGIAVVLNSLGELARVQHDVTRAARYYRESLGLLQDLEDAPGVAMVLHNLGWVEFSQGNYAQSATRFVDSLTKGWELGDKLLVAMCVSGLAVVAGQEGYLERAARLAGAADTLLAVLGARLDLPDQTIYAQNMDRLRVTLGDPAFAAGWADGQAMPLEQVVTDALEFRTQGESEPKQ